MTESLNMKIGRRNLIRALVLFSMEKTTQPDNVIAAPNGNIRRILTSLGNNNRNKVHNKCNALGLTQKPSSHLPHPLIQGKIVFHETAPWCQKVGGHWCKGNTQSLQGSKYHRWTFLIKVNATFPAPDLTSRTLCQSFPMVGYANCRA